MSKFFTVAVAIVLGLLGAVMYWHMNPNETPNFLRTFINREFRAPNSPLQNFRPPNF